MNRATFFCGLIVLSFCSTASADNWPNWRGPNNNGISKETKVPIEWSATKNMAWKLPLPGAGSSTPAVWGNHIFVTCIDGKDIQLLCVGTDGKLQWKRKLGTTGRVKLKASESNEASPSPSTDGKQVYAFDGSGDFACFDMLGKEIWRFDALERYGKFSTYHGLHTTPLLDGNRLYLTLLSAGGHWVVAIDTATGKDAWKVHRQTEAIRENLDAYTSPYIWRNDKETCLVVLGNDNLTGHSLKDGAELWRLTTKTKRTDVRLIPTPVATPEMLVACTGRGGDTMVALKPGAKGLIDASGPFVHWVKPKGAPDVCCPLLHNGLIYFSEDNGLFTCLDAAKGTPVYVEHLDHSGRYRGSPVLANGHIYVTARDEGCVSVVKTGRKFEKVADNKLDDYFTASPAIANGRIYLHGFRYLYAIEEKLP